MGKPRVRTSVVCLHNDRLLAFHAEDPQTKTNYVFLPGGKVESHETATEAAERETLEETGFHVEVSGSLGVDREYTFFWNGEDYDCLTIFYPARLKSPLQSPVQDAEYHRGVVWIPRDEIIKNFSYSSPILEAILELLPPKEDL